MKLSHDGRVAIVTGSARGIGQAIAIKLAERGAQLVLVDLDEPDETAEKIGGDVLTVKANVASAEDWARIGKATEQRFGRADIVVNNAGVGTVKTIDDLDYDLWRRTFSVNVDAHFYSAKEFVPRMRRNGWGRFVGISSNSIGIALPGMSHYMASKMGVIGFVRGLANDVAQDGITVNAILPAMTNTRLTRDIPEDVKRQTWQQQAIKRFAEPEDIAGPICFLTSDDGAFVTGQAIVVDGGQYKIS
jgi:NAD(P)-dependent dehydrogenase (short-subunit alcohol dehydrogenase family)